MLSPFLKAELYDLSRRNEVSLRSRQKARILTEVYRNHPCTRRRISTQLALRRGTVSEILRELLAVGLIRETVSPSSVKPGRPSSLLFPNIDRYVTLSFYVEGLRLRGGIVNLAEQIIGEDEVVLPREATGSDFVEAFIRLWHMLEAKTPQHSEVLAGAFSPVGAVNSEHKVWLSCNRWPQVKSIEFKEIEQRLGSWISIRRNLETVLAYEISRNPQYQSKRTALLHWGYGIGSAFSYAGTVLQTERGSSTGLGHVVVNSESTKKCQCGVLGCLEAEAALWALVPALQELGIGAPEDCVDRPDVLAELTPERPGAFADALTAVEHGVRILCKIYSPDHVLFLSPLAENHHVIERLRAAVQHSVPTTVEEAPSFRVVGTTFHGCLYANVHPVFERQLRHVIVSSDGRDVP